MATSVGPNLTANIDTVGGQYLEVNYSRQHLTIQNNGTVPVYANFVQPASVSNGVTILPGDDYSPKPVPSDGIYLIADPSATDTQPVVIIEG